MKPQDPAASPVDEPVAPRPPIGTRVDSVTRRVPATPCTTDGKPLSIERPFSCESLTASTARANSSRREYVSDDIVIRSAPPSSSSTRTPSACASIVATPKRGCSRMRPSARARRYACANVRSPTTSR